MNIINNKYYRWYINICNSRSDMKRVKHNGIYYESHHIIPKSLGGSNEDTNLVLLTPKEHFIAHLLLPKFLKGVEKSKMVRARWYLMHLPKYENRVTSKVFEKYKLERKRAIVSKETREKLSKAASGPNSYWYGKPGFFTGKKHSERTKKLMSEQRKGNTYSLGNTLTKEHKNKISKANKGSFNGMHGKNHTKESKNKMANASKGKNSHMFKGYFITPFGKFESARQASNEYFSSKVIQRYCKNSNKKITQASLSSSPYLQSLKECPLGKTYKDIGFDFLYLV